MSLTETQTKGKAMTMSKITFAKIEEVLTGLGKELCSDMSTAELLGIVNDRGVKTRMTAVLTVLQHLYGHRHDYTPSRFVATLFEVVDHPGTRKALHRKPKLAIHSDNYFVCEVGLSKAERSDKQGLDRLEKNARLIAAACTSYAKHCGPKAVECAEGDLLGELLGVCKKIVEWLDELAKQSEANAHSRFESLNDACRADASNYRATANSVIAVLAKATQTTGE